MALENPYPGARPLRASDSGLLFGRSRALADLERLVANCAIIEVSAPSGAGKTSLIDAGLCAPGRLDGWVIAPIRKWRALSVGGQDVSDLRDRYAAVLQEALEDAGRLDRNAGVGTAIVETVLRAGRACANPVDFVRLLQDRIGRRLLFVFDQFEEFIRTDPDAAVEFLRVASQVANEFPMGFVQMFVVRAEYASFLREIEYLPPRLWGYMPLSPELERGEQGDPDPIVQIIDVGRDESSSRRFGEFRDAVVELFKEALGTAGLKSGTPTPSAHGLLHLQALLWTVWNSSAGDVSIEVMTELAKEGLAGNDAWAPDNKVEEEERRRAGRFLDALMVRYVASRLEQQIPSHRARVDRSGAHETVEADEARRAADLWVVHIAALIPQHLASGGFKLRREYTELAARVLTAARDLDRWREDKHVGLPAAMQFADVGRRSAGLIAFLAARLATTRLDWGSNGGPDPLLVAQDLAEGSVADYAALREWGDPSMATFRRTEAVSVSPGSAVRHNAALLTAADLVVAFDRALGWLEGSTVIRRPSASSVELLHDGFSGPLAAWANRVMSDPATQIALPVAMSGKQVFGRPLEVNDEPVDLRAITSDEHDGRRVLSSIGWIACNVSAYFRDLVFVEGDLRGALFVGCRFDNVEFRNCLTHGLLFIDCTFDGSSFVFDGQGDATEVRTLTFRECTFDSLLTLRGITGGYGLFFDGGSGTVLVQESAFKHLGCSADIRVQVESSTVAFMDANVIEPGVGA